MKQKEMYPGLDPLLAQEADAVWRLCLLGCRNRPAADELCFQSFLRLAARSEKDRRSDRILLYDSACRLCEDWHARKMRKPPREDEIKSVFGCRKEDALWILSRQRLSVRLAAGLLQAGFSAREAEELISRRGVQKAASLPEAALRQLQEIQAPEAWADLLSDKVYDRFAERSVGLENSIHSWKSRLDRAAPWLALLILLFFAFCVWFVRRTLP